ncbi:MAG: outer membrane protein assembly factor BamC [Pseudomonadota bacterium]
MPLSNYIYCLLIIMFLSGCGSLPSLDDVLPDTRDEYRKSRDLPALEVPPDLTNNTNEAMAIPGEEEAVTLSEFQRQRAQATGATVLGKGEFGGEQWIALRGTPESIWPELLGFWQTQGYTMDLEDGDLGVMETAWKVREENNGALRERFRIFAEQNEDGETMLYLSSQQQLVTEGEWFDTQSDETREKEVIRQINLYFYGAEPAEVIAQTTSRSSSSTQSGRAQLIIVDKDRSYLTLPDNFENAWANINTALERAGVSIQNRNQESGIYDVLHFPVNTENDEEKGLLDKLKFWSNDDDEGIPFQISLTGVGDKTELNINDEDGNWAESVEAKDLLDLLLRYYNQL